MFSGHVFESWGFYVGPGQEIVDLIVWMAVDDPGDDVGEISVGFDTAEFAGFDQRRDGRPMIAAAIGTSEQCARR
jgi:hypothetical protein